MFDCFDLVGIALLSFIYFCSTNSRKLCHSLCLGVFKINAHFNFIFKSKQIVIRYFLGLVATQILKVVDHCMVSLKLKGIDKKGWIYCKLDPKILSVFCFEPFHIFEDKNVVKFKTFL